MDRYASQIKVNTASAFSIKWTKTRSFAIIVNRFHFIPFHSIRSESIFLFVEEFLSHILPRCVCARARLCYWQFDSDDMIDIHMYVQFMVWYGLLLTVFNRNCVLRFHHGKWKKRREIRVWKLLPSRTGNHMNSNGISGNAFSCVSHNECTVRVCVAPF